MAMSSLDVPAARYRSRRCNRLLKVFRGVVEASPDPPDREATLGLLACAEHLAASVEVLSRELERLGRKQ